MKVVIAFVCVAAIFLLCCANVGEAKMYIAFGPCNGTFYNNVELCVAYQMYTDDESERFSSPWTGPGMVGGNGGTVRLVPQNNANDSVIMSVPKKQLNRCRYVCTYLETSGKFVDVNSDLECEPLVPLVDVNTTFYDMGYSGCFASDVLNLTHSDYKMQPLQDILADLSPSVDIFNAGYFPVANWSVPKGIEIKSRDTWNHNMYYGCDNYGVLVGTEDQMLMGVFDVKFHVGNQEKFERTSFFGNKKWDFRFWFGDSSPEGKGSLTEAYSKYYEDVTPASVYDVLSYEVQECDNKDQCRDSCNGQDDSAVCADGVCEGASECWIATAALGSPLDPRLWILRTWRDNILRKSAMGRAFIKFYYDTSPPVAAYLYQRHTLCALTRVFVVLPAITAIQHTKLVVSCLFGGLMLPLSVWFMRRRMAAR